MTTQAFRRTGRTGGRSRERNRRYDAREVTRGGSRERNRRYGAREVTRGRSRERNRRYGAREVTRGRSRERNRSYDAREVTRGRSRERNRRYGAREVTGIIDDGRLTGRVSSIVIFPGVFANDSQNHSYPTSDAKEKHMAPKMLFTCGKSELVVPKSVPRVRFIR